MKQLKLKWFLYLLGARLAYRNRTNSAFHRAIASKELIIQIALRKPSINYYYQFSFGQIIPNIGQHQAPTLVLTFPDAYCARQALSHSLSHMPLLIQQINQGSLTVQGDIGVLVWFSAICEWATGNAKMLSESTS